MRTIYCDESIWIPVAEGLRRRGWSVRVARDEGMLGKADREQLAFAEENDWVFATFDNDFLSLVEAEGLAHAGLIFVRQPGRDIGDVVKAVDSHLSKRHEDDRGIAYV